MDIMDIEFNFPTPNNLQQNKKGSPILFTICEILVALAMSTDNQITIPKNFDLSESDIDVLDHLLSARGWTLNVTEESINVSKS